MKLQQRMSQRVVMTPLLQQAIQLLQLSTLELEQVVRKELEENPLLEEVPVENAENQENPDASAASATSEAAPTPETTSAVDPPSKETSSVDSEKADDLPFDLSSAVFDDHGDERTPVSMEERDELPFENLGRSRRVAGRAPDGAAPARHRRQGRPAHRRGHHRQPGRGRLPPGRRGRDRGGHGGEPRRGGGRAQAHPRLRPAGRRGAERAGVPAAPAHRGRRARPGLGGDRGAPLRGPGAAALRGDRAGPEAAAGAGHGVDRGDPGPRAQAGPALLDQRLPLRGAGRHHPEGGRRLRGDPERGRHPAPAGQLALPLAAAAVGRRGQAICRAEAALARCG